MLRGLVTVSLWANDVKAARAWYSDVLGIEPYFQRPDAENPAYVEFRLGDYQQELGIIDRRFCPIRSSHGAGRGRCLLARGRCGRHAAAVAGNRSDGIRAADTAW